MIARGSEVQGRVKRVWSVGLPLIGYTSIRKRKKKSYESKSKCLWRSKVKETDQGYKFFDRHLCASEAPARLAAPLSNLASETRSEHQELGARPRGPLHRQNSTVSSASESLECAAAFSQECECDI
jgi:hypothetical protein